VKKEPQIFNTLQAQDVPVSNAVLDVLEQEEMTESMVRTYVRGMLSEYSSPDAPDGRKMWYINAHWWEQPLERVVDSLYGDSPYTISARDLDRLFEWYHISSSWIGDDVGTVMEPRVPRHPYEDEDGRVIEDEFDPRISLAPTIDKALEALGSAATGHIYAVDIKDKSGDEIETRVPYGSHCPSSPNNEYGKDFNWEKYARHSGVDPDDDLHREEGVISCVPDQQTTQEAWHRSELWMVYVGQLKKGMQVRLSWDFIRWYGEMTGRLDRDYIVPRMVLNPIRELEEDEKQRIEDITRAMGKPKEAYPGYDPAEELDESAVREYIRGLLTESVEFREVDSPLSYNRGGHVKRLALCDTSVTDPPHESDYYFADVQEWERRGKTGRPLKKPRKGQLVPGVDDDCVIGFLDYHSQGTADDGAPMWYIDYMKTRDEFGGQKVASRLVDEFFRRHASEPGSYVHFGKMMHPSIGHLKDKMAEKYPENTVIGAVNYR